MNVTAVQNERGPRRQKLVKREKPEKKPRVRNFFLSSSQLERRKTTPAPPMLVTKSKAPSNAHQDMLIQILLTCLKQAQLNETFQTVAEHQRNVILRNVWSELFVLKASHWPIDVVPAVESCGDRHLLDIISATKTLSADLMELSLLEILILSRPEYAVDLEERLKLQCNLENAILRLEVYVSQKTLNSQGNQHRFEMLQDATRSQCVMRFGKLLLALRHLSLHFYESSLNNLLRNWTEETLPLE